MRSFRFSPGDTPKDALGNQTVGIASWKLNGTVHKWFETRADFCNRNKHNQNYKWHWNFFIVICLFLEKNFLYGQCVSLLYWQQPVYHSPGSELRKLQARVPQTFVCNQATRNCAIGHTCPMHPIWVGWTFLESGRIRSTDGEKLRNISKPKQVRLSCLMIRYACYLLLLPEGQILQTASKFFSICRSDTTGWLPKCPSDSDGVVASAEKVPLAIRRTISSHDGARFLYFWIFSGIVRITVGFFWLGKNKWSA